MRFRLSVWALAIITVMWSAPIQAQTFWSNSPPVSSTRSVSTTSPLGGGGALSGNLTLTCTTCATGPGSSTANGIAKFSDANGLALAASAGVFIDGSDRLGVGTSAPTHSITLNSTATGLVLHNQSDQVTNTEYLQLFWTGNIGTLQTANTGSGTLRSLSLKAGSSSSITINGQLTTITGNISSGAGATMTVQNGSSYSSTSAVQQGVMISGTVNQTSGTGGYDAIKANNTFTACGSAGCSFLRLQSSSTDIVRIDRNGKLYLDGTTTAGGVTGAQTINQPTGSVNFAALATSLVVTNSLVSTSDYVMCTVQTNDSTAKSCAAVPGSGSFTLYLDAAATGETKVAFWVIQPQ